MIFKFNVEIFNFARHVLDKESLPAVDHDNKIKIINWKLFNFKGPFPTLMQRAPRPTFLYHEIPQITENLLKSSYQEPSWTYSQLFYGKYICNSLLHSFLTVFWNLSGRIRRKNFFFKCYAWISSYSLNRVGEKDKVQICSLSRSAWGF